MSEPTEAAVAANSVVQNLTAAFAAQDAPAQVENPSEPEAKAEDAVKVEAEKADEPVKAEDPAKEVEPDKESDADKPDADADDESENEYTVLTYPSEDELKAAWPRAVPLKVVKQAAAWAEEAKQGKDTVTALGGEHYIKPLTKMASALQDDNAPPDAFQPFFEGIIEAAGDSALMKVLTQSIHMGFIQSPAWQANPETKAWGDELAGKVDAAMVDRFGVNAETMSNLADWQSIGAIDGFAKWLGEEFKDEDGEFDDLKFHEASKSFYNEIRGIRNNPKVKELTQKTLELERQLESREAEAKQVPEVDFDNSFGEYFGGVVDTVLPKVIFAGTPLADLATDTPEMKDRKAYFRDNIATKVRQSLDAGDRKKLLDGYKQGKHSTAIYQTTLAKAMETAIGKADSDRKMAEKTIAELYGKTRNAELLKKQEESAKKGTEEAPLKPTQPTEFASTDRPKTVKDVQKNLSDAFAAFDANR